MSEHTRLINEAFRLCHIYHKRYSVFPVRIGVHTSQRDIMPDAICLDMMHQDIPFFVDERAKEDKLNLYGTDGKYTNSTYLNAIVFVPLAMLPEAIQRHYRKKAS